MTMTLIKGLAALVPVCVLFGGSAALLFYSENYLVLVAS